MRAGMVLCLGAPFLLSTWPCNGRVLSPLSLLRGYRDQVKAVNPNTLFCSADDEMEKGSIIDLLSNGAATIEFCKELGLDVRPSATATLHTAWTS